jgi:Fe2+ transport system protein FeoA
MEKPMVSQDNDSMGQDVMALSEAPVGRTLRVVRLDGGHGMKRRLTDMGLHVGSVVRIARTGGTGPVIVWSKGGRIALGRGVLHRVLVTLAE